MFHEFRSNPTQTLFLVRISIYIRDMHTKFCKIFVECILRRPRPQTRDEHAWLFSFR